MSQRRILLTYLKVKILMLLFIGSVLLVQRIVAFWYDSTENFETISRQLAEDNVNPNERNDGGLTPLMLAAAEGDNEKVNLLLSYGADINAQASKDILLPDNQGNTALHFAVMNGNGDVARILLGYGANPYLGNVYGDTPLHYLSYFGNPDMQIDMFNVMMKEGSNLNIQNNEKATPLHWMVEQNNADIMEKATREYGDFINYTIKNKDGSTLIDLTMSLAKEPIMPFLTHTDNTTFGLKMGQNVNEIDNKGFAGVHLAAIQGNADYMQQLINNKADLSIQDRSGNTALYLAALFGFIDVIRVLLREKSPTNMVNNHGKTILMALMGVRTLSDRLEFMRQAIETGANINAQDNHGNTLLHLSVINNNSEWLRMLIRNFGSLLDFSIKNNAQQTPLEAAKARDYQELLPLLK